jgi:uncharacterized protein YaeQ
MLYNFELDFSDIDRGIYEKLNFRIAQHPSETGPYLLSRALAYALSYQEGLEFSPAGLGDPETPALWAKNAMGSIELWIEIGNPSAKKLHKASKIAKRVVVYTYKSPEVLFKEIQEYKVHRSNDIEIFSFPSAILQLIEKQLQKNNRWSILHQQGQLDIKTDLELFNFEIKNHSC